MRYPMMVAVTLGVLWGSALNTQEAQERIVDRVFAEYAKPGSPGCAVGVIRDGNLIYRKGYGMGSVELGVALSPESVFYMGSVSKQFTAAAVVLAQEQGYLKLDDNVRKYIPEIPDYGYTITLREMLLHTSGFRDFLSLFALAGRDVGGIHSRAEIIDMIARQKGLNNVPGEAWLYSNTNYYLLGIVIERTTKRSLNEFATENIFKPLGMMHTGFYDDHRLVLPGRVAAYDPGKDGKVLVDWSTSYDIVGAGGLMSTVDDLLLWDRNFYENKLGKGTLVKELQTKGVLNDGKQISYALGLQVESYRGLPTVEHDGGLYGYRTNILRFPDQQFTAVCLCNLSNTNPHDLSRRIADIYLDAELRRAVTSEPATPNEKGFPDANQFAGKYLDSRKHFTYTFSAADGQLMAWGAKLRRVGPNQFRDLGTGTITFEGSGADMKATLEMDGKAFFAGQRIEPLQLSATELAAYKGDYQSAELEATYTLKVEQGKLTLRNGWNPAENLTPLTKDGFESDEYGTIVFRRDANGQVGGFRVNTVEARDIGFDKTK
jgi:CubicO group peptidase (beta-lactamase class C family)